MLHCKGSLGTYAAAVQWVEEQLYEKVSFGRERTLKLVFVNGKLKYSIGKEYYVISVIICCQWKKMLVLRCICYH